MKTKGIIPNFFISEPYLTLSGAKGYTDYGWNWIEADDWCLFPPVKNVIPESGVMPPLECWWKDLGIKKIWTDFEGYKPFFFAPQFFDYEYIFNPMSFNEINGGKWNTYRKNIRKWPKQHEKWEYNKNFDEQAVKLLTSWLENKSETVLDAELITKYVLFKHWGIHRKYLYDEKDNLMAINIWDDNWYYINYRYCIVKKDQPFLDEFARYLFYTDQEIQTSGKLVNDGGCLGNDGLERFKDKMNPMKKRKVYLYV